MLILKAGELQIRQNSPHDHWVKKLSLFPVLRFFYYLCAKKTNLLTNNENNEESTIADAGINDSNPGSKLHKQETG